MISLRQLPVIALYAGSAVFISGLASLGAVSAFETSATVFTGLWWGAFAGSSVCIMAALAHWMPEWWIERRAARVFFGMLASVFCFAIAWWFDFSAIANLLNKVEVRQQTAFKSRNVVEKSDGEITADIARLQRELAEFDKEGVVENGQPRKVRPAKVIEQDGGYLKSANCTAATTAYQRAICREYEMAKDRAKKEAELAAAKAEVKGVRQNITSTAAVVSAGNVAAEKFAQVMGWEAHTTSTWQPVIFTFFAEIMCLILPGLAGWARMGMHEAAVPVGPADRWQPVQVHVHAAQQAAPAPQQVLALPSGARRYDPGRQARLVGEFWQATLPTAVKERQQVAKWLPDFDRACAKDGIETPSSAEFCTLSAPHLPNVEPLGGVLWFTPT